MKQLILSIIFILSMSIMAFSQQGTHSHEVVDNAGFVITSSEGICFRYNSYLIWHLGISDLIIFLCYVLIPLGMLQSLRSLPKGLALPLRNYSILLGFFIVTCGITHLLSVVLLFYPIWTTIIIFNWICAISSTIAAIYLWFYTRSTLQSVALNLKDVLSIKDSIRKLNELESLIDNKNHDNLTISSMKYQIELIRLNLNTLQKFQESIEK